MAKKVQLMTNAKEWQTVDGVEVLVDVPQEDLDPITDSSCVEIEGHRTLEETISQDNMFTPEIVETKVHSKVGGIYHDNVVDGAYEEAILYGNTQVNLVESMTSDTKYIPHSFTSFQGNESKIGNYHSGRTNQVAPLVKGVTMVNLCQEKSATIQYQHTTAVANHNAKPNTKYTLKCKFTEKNKNAGIMIQSYGYKDGKWGYIEISKTIQNLGDDVLLTFTTHEQADSIIIYNNPAFCEDANDSITLDDIMVIEGDVTDLDLPFFKGMRSVELSRPLTNLLHDGIYKTYGSTTQLSYSSGNVTVTANAIGTWQSANFHFINEDKLKPNTKYIVMWDSLTQTQTSTSSGSIIAVYDTKSGDGNINIGTANSKTECPVLRSIVFDTTGRDVSGIVLRIHATLSNSETGTTTVTGLRVFEWDDSLRTLDLQTIGYFSGTKYVSTRTLETEGKNLYPYGNVNFTNDYVGWCDVKGNIGLYGDIAKHSKHRFLLKKGTYTLSFGETTNVDILALIDDKEITVDGNITKTFTLTQDTYCTIRVKTIKANVATTVKNIQIERGETATTYEAYQGRYYKPRETEEIILRSLPNGVCDTFNLQTGEYVQNIGEIVLDGDENIKIVSSVSNDTHAYFDFDSVFVGALNHGDLICDSFAHIDEIYGSAQTVEGINIGNLYWGSIRILNSRLSSVDVAGFKTWLQENPVTVQYELSEPIITKLTTYDRVYSGQTNALVDMSNNLSALTYYSNNYYLKVGNLSPIPSIIEPITSLPYNVRLKPSTLYTIKYSRGGNSNSMKFDLGGSVVEKTNSITDLTGIAEELTVRTPAILSHEQLQLSGTGYAHNFIVVEGDTIGTELPYFQGMKDVKMPIVKNIGKNLFDGELIVDKGINQGTGAYHDSEDWVTTKNLIPITKGKKISITIDADDEDITTNRRYAYVYKYDMNGKFIANDRHDLGLNTKTYTMNHYGYIRCTIRTHNVRNITITETDTPQPCIDYRVNSVYAVQGEYPITSEMIEQGGFSMPYSSDGYYENAKYDNTAQLRSKELIPVKPNTTYAFAHSFSKFAYNVYQWNGNKKFIDGVSQYFNSGQIETITTTADTQYIHFLISKHDASQAIAISEYDWSQFHMYELDSTINLRSLPNGVKDELNLLTGEYIQRVGEVVLDGKNTQFIETLKEQKGDYFKFGMLLNPVAPYMHNICLLNDRFNSETYGTSKEGRQEQIYIHAHSSTNTELRVCILPSRLSTPDEIGFNDYLQSNPITVQYELAEPIISHVRLVSNNQEREVGVKLPNGVCNTYNPSTGITTVRVGKVVLDGSEEYSLHKTSAQTTVWYISNPLPNVMNFSENASVVAEGINAPYPPKSLENQTQEVCYISNTGKFNFTLLNTKASTVDELKTYLASNPITVWYELNYPQIQPDIVLPNGVHDEYNPETGVYTKRVGFAEFDGSVDEGWRAAQTDPSRFVCEILTDRKYYSSDVIKDCMLCDKIVVVSYSELYGTNGTDGVYGIAPYGGNVNIQMRLEGITTAEQLQQYLSQNPIKVWYELATPTTYQLTPYFGLPQPYAYEDGYLIHHSAYPEATLPPEFKYKLVANRTGQVIQNNRKLQEHTTRLSNLEALIIEATIQSLFDRELQTFELELMDIQLIDLGE